MPSEKRKTGDLGEGIAAEYLENNGYKIVERNYRKNWGEIDLIAQKDDCLIFVEVKTRKKAAGGLASSHFPEENVNWRKQEKLIRTAETYLLEKNYPDKTAWQIDVIAVELDNSKRRADLKHIKNAVWDNK